MSRGRFKRFLSSFLIQLRLSKIFSLFDFFNCCHLLFSNDDDRDDDNDDNNNCEVNDDDGDTSGDLLPRQKQQLQNGIKD